VENRCRLKNSLDAKQITPTLEVLNVGGAL